MNEDLDKVFIWSLNDPSRDLNAQSAIVSFAMPEIGMSFVCTGDAKNTTFETAEKAAKLLLSYDSYLQKGLLTLLILPHHGSDENTSPTMIEMFKPTILAISAGAGQHGHPRNATIQFYEKLYKEDPQLSDNIKSFLKQYNVNKHEYLCFMRDRGNIGPKRKRIASIVPIIATNLAGTL